MCVVFVPVISRSCPGPVKVVSIKLLMTFKGKVSCQVFTFKLDIILKYNFLIYVETVETHQKLAYAQWKQHI